MMLAAVPVSANSTSASGESNTVLTASAARCVASSLPYDATAPSLAATIASITFGWAGAALSEANA